MVTCEFFGSQFIGNTLFQIAATLSHAAKHDDVALFPEWRYGIEKVFKNQLWRRLKFDIVENEWVEPGFNFYEIPYMPNMILRGYFQSEKYFNSKLVRMAFAPADRLRNCVDEISNRFDLKNCVSLHVRRGDYLTLPDHHPVLPIEYYMEAVGHFSDKSVAIFSDDHDWCRDVLLGKLSPLCHSVTIIDGGDALVDFYAMTECQHHIIANSTFSWWGAWLGHNPEKKVIAPLAWFGSAYSHLDTSDLIPSSWVTI